MEDQGPMIGQHVLKSTIHLRSQLLLFIYIFLFFYFLLRGFLTKSPDFSYSFSSPSPTYLFQFSSSISQPQINQTCFQIKEKDPRASLLREGSNKTRWGWLSSSMKSDLMGCSWVPRVGVNLYIIYICLGVNEFDEKLVVFVLFGSCEICHDCLSLLFVCLLIALWLFDDCLML